MTRSAICRMLLLAVVVLAICSNPSAAQQPQGVLATPATVDTVRGWIHPLGLDPCVCGVNGFITQGPSINSPTVALLSGVAQSVYGILAGQMVKISGTWQDCAECVKFNVGTFYLTYVRGDANYDGVIDISDCVFLLAYIFSGGPAPTDARCGDPDCSGSTDISDVVLLVNYIFAGVEPPAC
jgi:hypothetical protein